MTDKSQTIAFQEFIEQYKGLLYKVARTYCAREEERQDLMQEMMIQLWKSFEHYDAGKSSSTWVYRIALNVAISYYRKSKTKKMVLISIEGYDTSEGQAINPEKEAQLKQLEQFISELKELDKALMLLYLEDKTYAEIAEILGISTSNVGTKVGRIKEKLKKRFTVQNNT